MALAYLRRAGLRSGGRVRYGVVLLGGLLGGGSAAANAQPWAEESLHGEQTYDQGEDQPKGCGEKITHACTRTDPDNLLLQPIMKVPERHRLWFAT